MLYSTSHSQSVARDLADDFSMRMKNSATINIVRQANDANGWPMIFLSHSASALPPGNEAEGQPVIVIRLMNINVGAVDIFGNSTLPFTPTQCEVAYELQSSGAPFPAFADLTTVLFQVSRTGVIVVNEPIANGTAVTEASMNAAQAAGPAQVLKDIDWGFKGNT
jgi:hypothetical protein